MTTTTIILTIISVTVISAAAEITKNRLIGYFHRDIMRLVYPPPPPTKEKGGAIVFDFSWDDCDTLEMFM